MWLCLANKMAANSGMIQLAGKIANCFKKTHNAGYFIG